MRRVRVILLILITAAIASFLHGALLLVLLAADRTQLLLVLNVVLVRRLSFLVAKHRLHLVRLGEQFFSLGAVLIIHKHQLRACR